MDKKIKIKIFLVIVLGIFFIPSHFASAWIFGDMADSIFKGLAYILMTLGGAILSMVGMLYDKIIDYTILNMATNINDSSGIGGGINTAWVTLRDVANMCFIFVLLGAAFKAMFQLEFGNVGKTITNIVIIALLINFSLFFTKVVIDASNIVSVGFYNSIASSSSTLTTSSGTTPTGISGGYMNALGLQNWYDTKILDSDLGPVKLMTIGVMSFIFMLVAAVIFLISAVMFAARYILLIFLMILSPLAFIAFVIPGQRGKFDEWKDAVLDQSFFAPVFFAMTWVALKLAKALNLTGSITTTSYATSMVTYDSSTSTLIMNYVLVIGFSIAALVFSKKIAGKTAGFSKITNAMGANKVAGVVGGVTLGGAAALGRRTIGATASRLAQSQRLSNWAGKSWIGQKVKEGTEKTAGASFDVRQTKAIGGVLQSTPLGSFGTGKTGGYDATLANQIAKKEKVAASLKTDQARQAYAQRQMSGIVSRFYTRGGRSPNHKPSLFGTLGRSNRIVASKIFTNQINKLNTDLSNGNAELTRYQRVLSGGGILTPTQNTRYTILTGPVGTKGSLADIQYQVTTLQTQVGTLGVTNTFTGQRADQQNF